eukprot:3981915-Pyramimonas_sp.AAC.1
MTTSQTGAVTVGRGEFIDAVVPIRRVPPRSSRLRAALATARWRLHRRAATVQEQAADQTSDI